MGNKKKKKKCSGKKRDSKEWGMWKCGAGLSLAISGLYTDLGKRRGTLFWVMSSWWVTDRTLGQK